MQIFMLMEILFNDQFIQGMFELHQNYLFPVSSLLAEMSERVDVLGQMQDAWFNFIDSGQVWALLIGSFFGYTFKGFTG